MELKEILESLRHIELSNIQVISDCVHDGKRKMDLRVSLSWETGSPDETPLVSEYSEQWLELKKKTLKQSAVDRLEATLNNQVLPWFGSLRLNQVTTESVQAWLDELAERYSYSTVSKAYQCLNAIFEYAKLSRVITENPVNGLVTLPSENVSRRDVVVYSDDECDRLTKACFASLPDEVNAPLLPFLLHTGLRIGEALALRWGDVDLKNAFVRVRKNVKSVKNRSGAADEPHYVMVEQETPKTKAGDRVVSLNAAAREALCSMPKRDHKQLVFSADGGSQFLTYSIARRLLARMCQKAAVRIRGFHAFRHTFATRLFERGVDVKTVSSILGHSSVRITYDIYIHSIQEQEAKAIAKLI